MGRVRTSATPLPPFVMSSPVWFSKSPRSWPVTSPRCCSDSTIGSSTTPVSDYLDIRDSRRMHRRAKSRLSSDRASSSSYPARNGGRRDMIHLSASSFSLSSSLSLSPSLPLSLTLLSSQVPPRAPPRPSGGPQADVLLRRLREGRQVPRGRYPAHRHHHGRRDLTRDR